MWMLVALVGCVFVRTSDGDTGFDACIDDVDCGVDAACVRGSCEAICVRDEDCPGAFGCVQPGPPHVDPLGCVERCGSDWDCKAGAVCGAGGACVE